MENPTERVMWCGHCGLQATYASQQAAEDAMQEHGMAHLRADPKANLTILITMPGTPLKYQISYASEDYRKSAWSTDEAAVRALLADYRERNPGRVAYILAEEDKRPTAGQRTLEVMPSG